MNMWSGILKKPRYNSLVARILINKGITDLKTN